MQKFEEIVASLIDRNPHIRKELTILLAEYKKIGRLNSKMLGAVERYKYRLSRAEQKLGEPIPDKIAHIYIRNGIVEDIKIETDKRQMVEMAIGKCVDSSELIYVLEQLESQGFVVSLDVKK